MPIIKPEVQKVLREAGLVKKIESSDSIDTILSESGLSKSEVIEELSSLARSSSNETLRLRALELAMKAHGLLKNDNAAVQVPNFTIVFQKDVVGDHDVNPILIPRELRKEEKDGIN